jgi:hypothetical protein
MAATPLPPSGLPPLDGPKTCDASGMLDIHRMFLHAFGEAPGLVDAVPAGDTERAAAVRTQLELVAAALHTHHEGEDAHLWDLIDARAPSCAAHVERMKTQHARMLVHLDALDRAIPVWAAAPGPDTAGPVTGALGGVVTALAAHFPDEETNIVPVMEHVMTRHEIEGFAKEARDATPKGQNWNMLGAILAGQPDGGRDWLSRNMPAPGRLVWRIVGAPRYARFRAALEGRAVRS